MPALGAGAAQVPPTEAEAAHDRLRALALAALVEQAPAALGAFGIDGTELVTNPRYRDLVDRGIHAASAGVAGGSGEREVSLDDATYLALTFPITAGAGGDLHQTRAAEGEELPGPPLEGPGRPAVAGEPSLNQGGSGHLGRGGGNGAAPRHEQR